MCFTLADGESAQASAHLPPHPPRRLDERQTFTFFGTLAATGSVTFASAAVGLSRKSAYALKKRDRTFASLWQRALAMAGKGRRNTGPMPAEGDEDGTAMMPARPSIGVKLDDPKRARAEAQRDRFFAALEKHPLNALSNQGIGEASCQDPETVRRWLFQKSA